MSERAVSLGAYARLLRENRNFRLLWMAQIVSELGDWLYTLAIYNLLIEFTGSARSVAFVFVLQVLPQVLVSPLAGVLNDRLSRRRIMIASDWARAAIVACMLLVRSREWIWFLYALLFFETLFWALFEPARNSILPNITRGKELMVANALASTTWSTIFAAGFSIGGFIAALAGRETVFAINAVSFVISALILRRMRCEEPHLDGLPPLRARELVDFSPIAEGLRYVSGDRRLLATMLAKTGLGLMGSNWVILTVMGDRVFPVRLFGGASEASMLGMSLLMGCRGVGALIGPFIGAYVAGQEPRRLRRGILVGFLCGAAGYLALGEARSMLEACLAVTLAHAGGSVIWVFSTTLLQLAADDRLRGRIFSTEFALAMLAAAAMNSAAGAFIDAGVPVARMATFTGLAMLFPSLAWLGALRLWAGVARRGES